MENKKGQIVESLVYQWKEPYPEIKVREKNSLYARAMLDNLGGRNSEMSAVSMYFYNHFITQKYPEIADAFHHISIVEMHHLEIFGQLALQLGEDPRLWSWDRGYRVYWSPSYHLHPVKIREVLDYALQEEKAAIDKYTKQADMIKDDGIVQQLHRIVEDERVHISLLNQLIEACSP